MTEFHKVVKTLSKDEDYTFKKAGLGSNAISQIIRKHMDERRRKETDMRRSSSSQSETDSSSTIGENSPDNACKATQLDDYFNKGKVYLPSGHKANEKKMVSILFSEEVGQGGRFFFFFFINVKK